MSKDTSLVAVEEQEQELEYIAHFKRCFPCCCAGTRAGCLLLSCMLNDASMVAVEEQELELDVHMLSFILNDASLVAVQELEQDVYCSAAF